MSKSHGGPSPLPNKLRAWVNKQAETRPRLQDPLAAAQTYCAFVLDDPAEKDPNLTDLAIVLDQIMVATHLARTLAAPAPPPTDLPPPAELDYDTHYRAIAERFPTLGYYHAVEPLRRPGHEPEPSIANARDDIFDIYKELKEALYYAEKAGKTTGVGHFLWSFEVHWGRHHVNLRSYVHGKLHEDH